MIKIHFDTVFRGMKEEVLNNWIKDNKSVLIGSALFTYNDSFISKVVRWITSIGKESVKFNPSHTGSIIEMDGILYVFNMRPLRATITPLANFLLHTPDVYALVMKDITLNNITFSRNISRHIGELYPFLSAISSIFSKRPTKRRRHCSEIHLRELQNQGFYTRVNPEITPLELYELLTKPTDD